VFAGPGTVSGNTIAFSGTIGNQQLTSGVTYDIVLFTVPSTLPTPAPTATPVASAQHLYTIVATANGPGIAKFALPLTPSSTPVVTAPAPLTASDSTIGSSLAVNAAHVVYTDVVSDAFFVLDQPIGSSSRPSATFCYSGCGDHQNSHSLMTVALSPFGFLAGTDAGAGGPVASSVLHFYNAPFSNQTVSASSQQLTHPAAGLIYDAAGNLFAAGSMFTSSGDVDEFAGNVLLAHVTAPIFVTSVAVNANQLAVAGSTGSPCTGTVLIYTLPLTSSSTPSATITNGVGGSCRYFVALDSAGYLYVSGTTPGLSAYAPPLSSSSSPSATLATGNLTNQIAIGP
ncbi:MAG TPA: hypothetical protein VN224_13940, partial [Xanthomonadales bacterium]|nr:hypothetical protein [Xanthomonadales bacterium]